MSSQQPSPEIHHTESFRLTDSDVPGEPRSSGLEDLAIRLPVTDRDGRIEIETPLLIGQMPDEIDHPDSNNGQVSLLRVPDISGSFPGYGRSDQAGIREMFNHVEEPIAQHILDEFNDHLVDLVLDELGSLEPGEFFPVADVTITGKRGEQWLCAEFEVAVYAELGDTIELTEDYWA